MHDTPATILVAEDDPATRTFLADELCADGYELLLADSVNDALRLLRTKFPDLVIVDVGLPDGSGLDVVRRVRAADGVADRIDATRRCWSLAAVAARSTGFAPSSTAPTTSWPSPSPTPSCAAGSVRCCAAPRAAGAPGACGSGRSSSTPPRAT